MGVPFSEVLKNRYTKIHKLREKVVQNWISANPGLKCTTGALFCVFLEDFVFVFREDCFEDSKLVRFRAVGPSGFNII